MVITFFAHYVYKYNEMDKRRVLAFLEETVGDKPCEFYLGGYGAFDTFAKKCCLEYKATHPNVKLIHVVAYPDGIFNAYGYDEKLYLPLDNFPPFLALRHRNAWLAEHADILITRARCRCGFVRPVLEIADRGNKKIFNLVETEQKNRLL